MHPYLWGSYYWYFIHCCAYNYKENKKDYYILFFDLLCKYLPCIDCRKSYKYYYENNKLNFKNKNDLIEWTCKLHNYVNEKRNVSTRCSSEVSDLYSSINHNKLKQFLKIISELYKTNFIKNKNFIETIIQLLPYELNYPIKNDNVSNQIFLLEKKIYKDKSLLDYLLFFKCGKNLYFTLFPYNKINNIKIIKNKYYKKIQINKNFSCKLDSDVNITSIKLITTSEYDYLQRLNKVKNKNYIIHIL